MSKKPTFRGDFEKWHGKRAQNTVQSWTLIDSCEYNSVEEILSEWYA